MSFIRTISSISNQESFGSKNVFSSLQAIDHDSDVINPDYKEFVPPAALRRLSPVLRMGLTTAIDCQNKTEEPFDAISVGTALGCLRDTEKFLVTINTATGDVLSPTAFIQSTHNTIGGQISLGLGNHAYNMTHTQNALSFEVALEDGLMCIAEGKTNVLVGAAEEKIEFLEQLVPKLIPKSIPLSSGATFLVLSSQSIGSIKIQDVHCDFNNSLSNNGIELFLSSNGLNPSQIDIALHSGEFPDALASTEININYLKYSGLHYSASSFGLHIGHDFLKNSDKSTALIINTICPGRHALTLLVKE